MSEGHQVTLGQGKLLTAEQSARLALLSCVERDQQIAFIAAGLRRSFHLKRRGGWCPRHFYSQAFTPSAAQPRQGYLVNIATQ